MPIKIKSLDSIEVEIGHVNEIKSDEYGNSSTIFSTFLVQLPDPNEKKAFMDEYDSQVKCPYCNNSIKLTYAKTKMSLVPAIEENKAALKSINRKKILLITIGVFFLIEAFHWWFSYVFTEGNLGSDSRLLLINICISLFLLILVYIVTRITLFSSLKSSFDQKKNLLISARSVKKIKNNLRSLGTFDIITQVRIELKNKFYEGDHFVVGEYVSGQTDFGIFENKVSTGHELTAFVNIDMDQYTNFLDTVPFDKNGGS